MHRHGGVLDHGGGGRAEGVHVVEQAQVAETQIVLERNADPAAHAAGDAGIDQEAVQVVFADAGVFNGEPDRFAGEPGRVVSVDLAHFGDAQPADGGLSSNRICHESPPLALRGSLAAAAHGTRRFNTQRAGASVVRARTDLNGNEPTDAEATFPARRCPVLHALGLHDRRIGRIRGRHDLRIRRVQRAQLGGRTEPPHGSDIGCQG